MCALVSLDVCPLYTCLHLLEIKSGNQKVGQRIPEFFFFSFPFQMSDFTWEWKVTVTAPPGFVGVTLIRK